MHPQIELRAGLVMARLPEPVESGIRGARQYPFVRNVAWPGIAPERMPRMPLPTAGRTSRVARQQSTGDRILAQLAEIAEEITGIPADEIRMDADIVEDLDIDSLSAVELAVAAEEKFGVAIPDDSLRNIRTVRDAVELIQKFQR